MHISNNYCQQWLIKKFGARYGEEGYILAPLYDESILTSDGKCLFIDVKIYGFVLKTLTGTYHIDACVELCFEATRDKIVPARYKRSGPHANALRPLIKDKALPPAEQAEVFAALQTCPITTDPGLYVGDMAADLSQIPYEVGEPLKPILVYFLCTPTEAILNQYLDHCDAMVYEHRVHALALIAHLMKISGYKPLTAGTAYLKLVEAYQAVQAKQDIWRTTLTDGSSHRLELGDDSFEASDDEAAVPAAPVTVVTVEELHICFKTECTRLPFESSEPVVPVEPSFFNTSMMPAVSPINISPPAEPDEESGTPPAPSPTTASLGYTAAADPPALVDTSGSIALGTAVAALPGQSILTLQPYVAEGKEEEENEDETDTHARTVSVSPINFP